MGKITFLFHYLQEEQIVISEYTVKRVSDLDKRFHITIDGKKDQRASSTLDAILGTMFLYMWFKEKKNLSTKPKSTYSPHFSIPNEIVFDDKIDKSYSIAGNGVIESTYDYYFNDLILNSY